MRAGKKCFMVKYGSMVEVCCKDRLGRDGNEKTKLYILRLDDESDWKRTVGKSGVVVLANEVPHFATDIHTWVGQTHVSTAKAASFTVQSQRGSSRG